MLMNMRKSNQTAYIWKKVRERKNREEKSRKEKKKRKTGWRESERIDIKRRE